MPPRPAPGGRALNLPGSARAETARGVLAALALLALVGVDLGAPGLLEAGSAWGCAFRLENPEPGLDDGFGRALAVHGGLLFVGAPFDDDAAPDAGAVYVFDAATGALRSKLRAPAATAGAAFGGALAAAGDRLVVGPAKNLAPPRASAAHLFDLPSLGAVAELPADPPRHGAAVRSTVAASAQVVAVGWPWSAQGQVQLHDPATGARRVTLLQGEAPEQTATQRAGFGIALAAGGATVAIGEAAPTLRGSVAVHDAATGALRDRIRGPGPGYFGRDLALAGDRLFVGDGDTREVHVFDLPGGAPRPPVRSPERADPPTFGMVLAASPLGLLVGNVPFDAEDDFMIARGLLAVHLVDPADGRELHRFEPAEPLMATGFGFAVAADAASVFVGAPEADGSGERSGAVHVFRRAAGLGAFPPACAEPDPAELPGCDAVPDGDGDGLDPAAEAAAGTDPCDPDGDGDGLGDGIEVRAVGTRPDAADTDADGLTDAEEVLEHGTDPTRGDTDGDGFGDRAEVEAGSDPRDPLSNPVTALVPLPGTVPGS